MTTYERIRELDRLYLAADKLSWLALESDGWVKKTLHRAASKVWAKYHALVKSRKGLPR